MHRERKARRPAFHELALLLPHDGQDFNGEVEIRLAG